MFDTSIPATVSAAITATATVLSAAITALVPRLIARSDEKKRFPLVPNSAIVVGKWKGTGTDSYVENSSPPMPFVLILNLAASQNKIVGTGDLEGVEAQLALEGGFFNDRYVQFAYKSVAPSRMQMGVIVLRISAEGDTLTGHYAGFSPARETFVMGNVLLKRSL